MPIISRAAGRTHVVSDCTVYGDSIRVIHFIRVIRGYGLASGASIPNYHLNGFFRNLVASLLSRGPQSESRIAL
jgi:hypothetical protein